MSLLLQNVHVNPPFFCPHIYEVSNQHYWTPELILFILKGGFVGTIQLIPDTVPFSVSQDRTITVKTSAGLDRETDPSFQFQVRMWRAPSD